MLDSGLYTSFMHYILFIYLFIYDYAGFSLLHGLFSSCGEGGSSLAVACGFLIAGASLTAGHRL